jgi:hypothetical protein
MNSKIKCIFFICFFIFTSNIYGEEISLSKNSIYKNLFDLNTKIIDAYVFETNKNIIEQFIIDKSLYNFDNKELSLAFINLLNTNYEDSGPINDRRLLIFFSGGLLNKLLLRKNPAKGFKWINENFEKLNDLGKSIIILCLNRNCVQTWDIRFIALDDHTPRKVGWQQFKLCDEVYSSMRSLIREKNKPLSDTLPEICKNKISAPLGNKSEEIISKFKIWWTEHKEELLKDKVYISGIDDTIQELKNKIVERICLQKKKMGID